MFPQQHPAPQQVIIQPPLDPRPQGQGALCLSVLLQMACFYSSGRGLMQALPFLPPLCSLLAHLTILGERGKERGRVGRRVGGRGGTAGHRKTWTPPLSPPKWSGCYPVQPWAGLFALLTLASQLQNEGVSLAAASGCPLPALKIRLPSDWASSHF